MSSSPTPLCTSQPVLLNIHKMNVKPYVVDSRDLLRHSFMGHNYVFVYKNYVCGKKTFLRLSVKLNYEYYTIHIPDVDNYSIKNNTQKNLQFNISISFHLMNILS